MYCIILSFSGPSPAIIKFIRGKSFITFTSVKIPLKGLGVSNTTRGAVASWSKTLAAELAPMGITVNNILPGATGTDRLQQIIEGKAMKQNENIRQKKLQKEFPV